MKKKKLFDFRSVVFGVAGICWTLFVMWLDHGWQWWLLGALTIAILARLAMGPRVRAFAFCTGALMSVVVIFTYLFGYPVYDNLRHERPFDAGIWRQNPANADVMWPPRLCMVDDLLKKHDLHGWKRSKVEKLLGHPDLTEWEKEGQMVYRLGPERGLFRIDSEWLVITLDGKERVTTYVLARD